MSDDDIVVRVDNVSKRFCRNLRRSLWYGIRDIAGEVNPFFRNGDSSEFPLRKDEFCAVKGASFQLRRGECLGLIGRNGAGKTTLLKMLNGLIKPDSGRIEMHGRVGALIALGAGFNPILTGRENIYINGAVLGLPKREIDSKLDEIIEFAGINDFIDSPVQSYSSGMAVRLGFAIATALDPDVLLVDEVLAVGDVRFRWKCLERIQSLVRRGVSIILVSHNTADLMRTCSNGIVMQRGQIAFRGNIADAVLSYQNAESAVADYDASAINPDSPIVIRTVEFKVDGKRSSSYRAGQDLTIDVEVEALDTVEEVRFIIGLYHGQRGPLFHVSSFMDNGWMKLVCGRHKVCLRLGSVPLQFGTYYGVASVRGPTLADLYDQRETRAALHITEPEPNYEGFGVNGILLPKARWTMITESDMHREHSIRPSRGLV
jgi:lipopolysaccharide transport system ATP-binding protein